MYLECEILFSPPCTPSSCSNDCILLAHLLYSEPNGKRRSCVTKSRQGAKLLDGSLVDRMRQASRKYSFAPARPAGLPGPCVLPRISSYAVGRFRLKKKKYARLKPKFTSLMFIWVILVLHVVRMSAGLQMPAPHTPDTLHHSFVIRMRKVGSTGKRSM